MRENSKASFRERILEASRSNKSRIVLAIDVHRDEPVETASQVLDLVERTHRSICSVKLGRHTVLSLGLKKSFDLLEKIHEYSLPGIIDDKLNDIDETNLGITRTYLSLGFDALTVNPFAGWKGGLESSFGLAHKSGMGVIVLVYMSHPGASEGYGQTVIEGQTGKVRPQFEMFAEKAVEWQADGAVVGATRPEIVQRVKKILGDKVPIFSPGIGTQGGEISRSLKSGTNYFIIGRSITKAENPGNAAEGFAKQSIALD